MTGLTVTSGNTTTLTQENQYNHEGSLGEEDEYEKIAILISVLSIFVFFSGCNLKDVQNYRWCTDLVHAIEKDDLKEVESLLTESNMDINREGNIFLQFFFGSECSPSTPFEAAVLSNNLELMKAILDYDGVVAFSDEFNPVCWMIYSTNDGTWQQRHEIVRLMLEKGLDPDFVPESGESTLCGIAGERVEFDDTNDYNSERAEAVLELYQFAIEQCDTKEQVDTADGATSIHNAVNGGNLPLIQYLVEEQQYSVNERTDEGETPLLYFVKYGLPYDGALSNAEEVITYCKAQGADLSITDIEGKTAYDYAIENGSVELAAMLKSTP